MYVAKGSSSSSSSIAAEKLGKPETCAGDFGERCNASRPTPNNEVENNDWYDEVSQSEGAEDSPGNGRTPSGSEWPTERELKYHVGGTKHWQAEISGTPPVDYKDYYDKAYQDDHISGTTCVHVLIDKQSDLDKSKHEKEFLQDDFQAPLNLILPDNYEQLNDLNAPTEQLLDKFRKRRDSSSHLNDKYKNTLENPLMNLADSSFGESLTKIREAEENRPLGELSESYNIGRSLLALKTSRSKSKMLDKSQLNSIKQEKKKKLALKSNVREKKRSENSKFKDKNSFHDGQTDTLLAKVIKMINVEYPDGQSVTNEQETPLKDKHYKKEEFNHNKPRSLLQKVKSIINRAMDKSKQDETLVNSNKLDAPIDLLDSGPSESANKKNKAIAKVKHLENSKLSDKLEYRKSDSKVAQKTSENFKDHIDKDTKLKDRSKLVNIDTIIPAVKESLKHRNLGNVEKIIIYVDKSEEKNAVPWKQGIPESEDTFNIDKKLSRHKSYLSPDINGGKLIDRSTLSEELKLKACCSWCWDSPRGNENRI
ncbi:uncharacterized protein [Prorops nasuta]|uniref:uncharacterized protein n=1 Tax=Prorops nasuta TaxID=863751 RepID=UPI0034CEF9CC